MQIFIIILINNMSQIIRDWQLKSNAHKSRSITEPKQHHFHSYNNSRSESYNQIQFPHLKQNKLRIFQQQLNSLTIEENRLSSKSYNKKRKKQLKSLQMSMEMKDIKSNISQLKQKLFGYQNNLSLRTQLLQKIVTKQKSRKTKNIFLPMIPTPQNPYMMPYYPFNPFMFPPPKPKDQQGQHQSQQKQKPKKKPKKKVFDKVRLNKILKKVFRAVTYTVYLKRLAKLIQNKRRIVFNKFWPQNLNKSTTAMRKWFSFSCKKFFDEMIRKSEAELHIEGDQNDSLLNQKKKVLKHLIKILVSCLQNLVQNQTFQQIAQILHIFCKHGGLIDNGVMTPEQLDTVCISEVNGCLRLDRNLQKSQIVNVLFIKLIIYNMLLQPWKYNQKIFDINENKQAYQNFYILSSLFYQIMLEVQDKLLTQSVSSGNNIELGNWTDLKSKFKIKCSPSLCHLDSNYEDGQMISGLVSQKTIKTIFGDSFWSEQIQKLDHILDKMHAKLRKVHAKFINQIYNYKDMTKFA